MKVLTAAQMREVDRRTIDLGIPGIVLMENAGNRVVDLLAERFAPLSAARVAVLCGKGNNGGDGMVVARQLRTRFQPAALEVVLFADPEELKGEAAQNLRMLQACGCPVRREISVEARRATVVVDALLGTGVTGPAQGAMLEAIRAVNHDFPDAKVVAVDMPSGMPSDSGEPVGEQARADYTVTFTAAKVSQALAPNCDRVGKLVVAAIGSPPELYESDDSIFLSLLEPGMFRHLLAPRPRDGHKGTFGHVLVVGGSRGKTGAPAMAGIAALRAGAGLVTVASSESAISVIATHAAELMTEPLPESDAGWISSAALDRVQSLAQRKDVIAVGPGLGQNSDTAVVVKRIVEDFEAPVVVDADALVRDACCSKRAGGRLRVMTPHPGEMARLTGKSITDIQNDRLDQARLFATHQQVTLVLKGQRTAIAFPDGQVWINPTGTPAMGTGGTGDVLTGLIAGFLAQFHQDPDHAVAAAVYLHGLAGQIGAAAIGEKCLIATDILKYLPDAIKECADASHRV